MSVDDHAEFVFVGRLWVVAPWPRPTDHQDFVKSICNLVLSTQGKPDGTIVPLFTELEGAEAFVARQDEPSNWKPISTQDLADFKLLLVGLLLLGETHVIIDPEVNKRGTIFTIVSLVEGIDRKK